MWKQMKMPICGIIMLLLSAASMATKSSAETMAPNASLCSDVSSNYYIVTRLDPRMCPAPICGGYFVKEVNKPKTKCADGTWQRDCHAGQLDAFALGWSSDALASFSEQFGQRHALVRGKLRQIELDSLKADTLVVEEGWLGQALSKPIGTFFGAKATGIVCITFPCPSILERKLNFRTKRLLVEIDLAASGASGEQVETGYKALSWPVGILAVGEHQMITDPAGRALKLVTSEFYLPVAAKNPPDGQVCGGIQGLGCPRGQFCDIDIPNACGGVDLSGICRIPPQVCPEIYAPVCGCDGVTYGNDCERQAARIQLDHPGECLKP